MKIMAFMKIGAGSLLCPCGWERLDLYMFSPVIESIATCLLYSRDYSLRILPRRNSYFMVVEALTLVIGV